MLAMLGIIFVLGRGAVATSIEESKAKYALEAWLEQMAAHLVTFKSAGGAEYAVRRSQGLLEDYLSYRVKHFKILVRQIVGSFALQAVASSALLGIGGWLVIERQLTLGPARGQRAIVVTLMMSAFTKFGKQLEVFYDLCAAIDKLGDLVDLPLERSGGEAVSAGTGPMAVSLRDLEVQYADGTRPALADPRLDHRRGRAGGGDRTERVGQEHARRRAVRSARAHQRHAAASMASTFATCRWRRSGPDVALVRGVELFPGTVLDNVRLGREHLSHADVSEALAAVGLLDELQALPDGLATELQPHGRPLSHRQACRLMIARAIVGRPRLIVLDGAIDQIDQHDEQERLAAMLFAPDAPWTAGLHHRAAGPARALLPGGDAAGRRSAGPRRMTR